MHADGLSRVAAFFHVALDAHQVRVGLGRESGAQGEHVGVDAADSAHNGGVGGLGQDDAGQATGREVHAEAGNGRDCVGEIAEVHEQLEQRDARHFVHWAAVAAGEDGTGVICGQR